MVGRGFPVHSSRLPAARWGIAPRRIANHDDGLNTGEAKLIESSERVAASMIESLLAKFAREHIKAANDVV